MLAKSDFQISNEEGMKILSSLQREKNSKRENSPALAMSLREFGIGVDKKFFSISKKKQKTKTNLKQDFKIGSFLFSISRRLKTRTNPSLGFYQRQKKNK